MEQKIEKLIFWIAVCWIFGGIGIVFVVCPAVAIIGLIGIIFLGAMLDTSRNEFRSKR